MKPTDMNPQQIRIRILQAGTTQAEIARKAGVSPSMVYHVIEGNSVSDNVRRVVAESIGMDVKRIWPSTYIFGGGPSKPGRPGHKKKCAA